MKKPNRYELKEWLCMKCIVGLKVHFIQTGTDDTDTQWELIPDVGKPWKILAGSVKDLVEVKPDWVTVLRPLVSVQDEVKAYKQFAKDEAKDLAEYERLKKKFS